MDLNDLHVPHPLDGDLILKLNPPTIFDQEGVFPV